MLEEPTRHDLEERTAAVARRLERAYGIPERRPPKAVLDGLIATLLSQNTTAANARHAWSRLKERFPDWHAVLLADHESVAEAIRPAGLAETRARHVRTILEQVLAEHGQLDLEELREWHSDAVAAYLVRLPGVGAKTAACVLLFDLQREEFPVDVHIWRIARRLGWAGLGSGRDEVYRRVAPCVPPSLRYSLHVNLIRLGRTLCRPRTPKCGDCPLCSLCPAAGRISGP